MGIYLRQPAVLCGVAAKRRKFWLVAAFVPLSLGLSEPALAQTCGPLGATGSVTCTTGGNNYTGGINYGNTGVPTTVTLDPGVQVFVTPGNSVDNPGYWEPNPCGGGFQVPTRPHSAPAPRGA